VTRLGEKRSVYTFSVGKQDTKNLLEDRVDGRVVIKYYLKNRMAVGGVDSSGSG
jgi:hypothetical protein